MTLDMVGALMPCSPALLQLASVLPRDEMVGTDRVQEPADEQRKSFLGERVEDAVSLTPLANQSRRLQHAEMARHRRTADRESKPPRRQVASDATKGVH